MDRKSIRVCAERRRNRENVCGESVVQRKTHTSLAHAHAHTYIYIYREREREGTAVSFFTRALCCCIDIYKHTSQVKKSPLQKFPQKILRNTFVDKQMSVHIGAMGQDRPPAPMKLKSAEFYELVRAIGTFRSKIKRILFSQILCRFSVTNGISLKMFPFFSLERENISARTRCGFCSLRI